MAARLAVAFSAPMASILVLLLLVPVRSRADDPQMPDTTGMGNAMSKMMEMTEKMQASMPEAQMKKLEYRQGDAWAGFDLVTAELDTGVGAGAMAKAMVGIGGPKSWVVVQEEAADLVLTTSQPRFRFAGEKQEAQKIQLVAFELHEGNRRAQLDSGQQTEFFKKGIDLKLTKIEDGVWELAPKKGLAPGQYGLANSPVGPVADFAIVEEEVK